jgi:zinc protease
MGVVLIWKVLNAETSVSMRDFADCLSYRGAAKCALVSPMTRLLITVLCLAVCVDSLAAAPVAPIPPMKFTHRTLANGLEVYAAPDHATPTVAINVWYHVGSKDDPEGRSGFAHLFEHIMFKGTRHTKPETIDRLTEDVGGSNNAYTADDVTVFYEVVPSNHLERLLWAEADRMTGLNVDDRNFQSEREVVKQEYLQRVEAEPYGKFGEEIQKKSFAVHPYKRPTIGNIAELNAATLDNVRAFHTTYYRPDNATLVVVGDFDPAQLDAWVDKYFGPVAKPGAPIPRVTIKEPARTREQRFVEYDPNVPLPAVAVTFLGPAARSADSLPLDIAQEILAGGESSRLYQRLVYEKQVAQSVEFDADLREDLGLLIFQVVLASGKTVGDVERLLFKELEKIAGELVGDGELAKAKNRLLTSRLHERETCEGKASALGQAAIVLGDATRVDSDLGRLQEVTAEDVQRAVRAVLTPENRLVLECFPAAMKPKKPGEKGAAKK